MAHWSYEHPELARFVRSRKLLPIVAVLALAALGGLGWGAVAIGRGATPAPAAANAGGGSAAAVSLTPVAERPASVTPELKQAHCWDGSAAQDLSMCSDPLGAAGLRYIYPAFGDKGSCKAMSYRKNTTVTFDCTFRKHELVRYRWWRDTSEAEGHFRYRYRNGATSPLVVAGKSVGTIYRDTKAINGVYNMTGFMRGNFAFTVRASTKARQRALLKIIEMRHPDDFAGYSLESGPKGTVHVPS